MSARTVHKNFCDHYNPEVAVSIDSLTQLAGRIRRTQPREVVSCVSGDRWAIATTASEEVSYGVHQSRPLQLTKYGNLASVRATH